ncbi:hypothetical protein EJB05_40013, partial [Eragrostis curvula]
MAFSFSWPFRRRGSGGGSASKSAAATPEDEELGVTPQLLDFLRTLSPDAFKSAALQLQGNRPLIISCAPDPTAQFDPDEVPRAQPPATSPAGRSSMRCSSYREPRLVALGSRFAAQFCPSELAKIRYDLCPRHMKDKQFWRIYFLLAKTYISPYELRAIQKEKLRRMETESGRSKEVVTVEVEMQESKGSRGSQSEVELESQAS